MRMKYGHSNRIRRVVGQEALALTGQWISIVQKAKIVT